MSDLIVKLLTNLLQVAFLLFVSPLLEGLLKRLEEMVQGKHGPSIFQVYRDIWKLFHKDEVVSSQTTWIFRFAPVISFAMPVFVVLLIPELTAFPLFFAFMGDMVAVGFLFALSGFFTALAAIDTGNPYGPVGASRTRMIGFLAEPVFMAVFFAVSFVANATIPYIVNSAWVVSWAAFLQPAHVLVIVAFLLLILADEGRIPVDSHAGKVEIAMIGHSRGLEYSGSGAALMKWAGAMKLMVLMIVFLNVLVTPWGLARDNSLVSVLIAMPLVMIKFLVFIVVLVAIEMSMAKLRLFRISEFLSAAFVICVFAMSVRLVGL